MVRRRWILFYLAAAPLATASAAVRLAPLRIAPVRAPALGLPFLGTSAPRLSPLTSLDLKGVSLHSGLSAVPSLIAAPNAVKAAAPQALPSLRAFASSLKKAGRKDAALAAPMLNKTYDGSEYPADSSPAPELPAELPIPSRLPESRAWRYVGGKPLLGRFLTPRGVTYGRRKYIDLMNPTVKEFAYAGGKRRTFMWVRAVRAPYQTSRKRDGSAHTKNYLSDTLLFELVDGQRPKFIERTFESVETRRLEDARVSSFRIRRQGPGTKIYGVEERHYLGFTVHARHGGMKVLTSRNAFVRLRLDERGIPRLERTGRGRPRLRYLSPEPVRLPGRGKPRYAHTDAKNGILMTNAKGDLRLHSRLRFHPDDPRLPEGFVSSDYAEQSFPVSSKEIEEGVDWNRFMRDADKHETMRSDQMEEFYPKDKLWPGSGKGIGPGAQPVRVKRVGSKLLVSEGWGFPWVSAGRLSERARAYLENRKTFFLSMDHEIRILNIESRRKRVYTISAKLYNDSLDEVLSYAPDLVQPQREHETRNWGVADLWHVYPTGRLVMPSGELDTFEGAADANVIRRRWNLPQLFDEMAERAGI